jgi:hypothetical protein
MERPGEQERREGVEDQKPDAIGEGGRTEQARDEMEGKGEDRDAQPPRVLKAGATPEEVVTAVRRMRLDREVPREQRALLEHDVRSPRRVPLSPLGDDLRLVVEVRRACAGRRDVDEPGAKSSQALARAR